MTDDTLETTEWSEVITDAEGRIRGVVKHNPARVAELEHENAEQKRENTQLRIALAEQASLRTAAEQRAEQAEQQLDEERQQREAEELALPERVQEAVLPLLAEQYHRGQQDERRERRQQHRHLLAVAQQAEQERRDRIASLMPGGQLDYVGQQQADQ
jgi:uncharacterized membrane-anchored protein